jgi:type IV secretory pathway VirB6-like protein
MPPRTVATHLFQLLINSPLLPGLTRDSDGGLTLVIQHDSPGKVCSSFFVASISMTFIISFGSLFIAGAFFPYTRRFFDGWAGAVVTAALTQIFVVTLLALFVVVQSNMLAALNDTVTGQATGDNAGVFESAIRDLASALAMAAIFAS